MPTARPTALIFGVTGQDGAYLSRFLLDKGYRVQGAVRGGSNPELANLCALDIAGQVELLPLDHSNDRSVREIIEVTAPDEVYNLAARSSVGESFREPVMAGEINALFVARVLHALREVKPDTRFFQASSSEIFGARGGILDETTPLGPANPYGIAKAYAHWMTTNFRVAFNLHANCGILFNHESPLRGENFVTRKITLAVAKIKHGLQHELCLGNLEVERDWGFAGDYVEAMWLMLQRPDPGDFIIATGWSHRLNEWVKESFSCVGLDYREFVRIDQTLLRPTDAAAAAADPSKAAAQLGWRAKVKFEQLVEMMVEADLQRVARGEIAAD